MTAPHARSWERFLALYEMTAVGSNVTRVAVRIGRHPQSVMQSVHLYNAGGPEAVSYQRTGGPLAPRSRPASVRWCAAQSVAARPPIVEQAPPPRWTLRRLVQ